MGERSAESIHRRASQAIEVEKRNRRGRTRSFRFPGIAKNVEPRPGLEPGTCRLLQKYHVVDSASSFLRLVSPFCTIFRACCSLCVPSRIERILGAKERRGSGSHPVLQARPKHRGFTCFSVIYASQVFLPAALSSRAGCSCHPP